MQGQVDRVLGQGRRERARAVQVSAGALPEAERTGRPVGGSAEAPVQRVRQPHQIVETRAGGHHFRFARWRHIRSRPRRTSAPAETARTGETAQPEPDQTVQPQDETADPRHDQRRRRRRGWRGRLQRQLNATGSTRGTKRKTIPKITSYNGYRT